MIIQNILADSRIHIKGSRRSIKIINFHRVFYFGKRRGCFFPGADASFVEDIHDSRNILLQFMAFRLDRFKLLHQNGIEEFFHFYVS